MTEQQNNTQDIHGATGNGDSAESTGGWLDALVGIVASPRKSFEIIRRRRPWVAPAILLVLGTVVLPLVSRPFIAQATRAQLTTMMPNNPEQVEVLMEQVQQAGTVSNWLTGIAETGGLAIGILIQATFIWLLAVAFQGKPRFTVSLSLVVHLNVIEHLKDWANYLLLSARGPDAIESAFDLQAPMGLDLLLAGDNAALNTVFASINPFTIWFVALLGLGASVALGLPKRQAYIVAAIYWATGTVFQAGLLGILSRFMPG